MEAHDDLLPCPFCGGGAYTYSSPNDYAKPDGERVHTVCCRVCACEGGWAKTESGARRNWNRRTPTTTTTAPPASE
jgi:Lar family restriction alleviation protein